jgi:hypothetical protein
MREGTGVFDFWPWETGTCISFSSFEKTGETQSPFNSPIVRLKREYKE